MAAQFLRSEHRALSIDWGTTVLGVLDVNAGIYTPYRGGRIVDGILRLIEYTNTLVSFNGNSSDLPKIAEYSGMPEHMELRLRRSYVDMLEITSQILWPNATSILGSGAARSD